MRLVNWNAGLWAVGNGLVSVTLIIYLAADRGAQGIAISLIIAAPRFASLFQMGVPALIGRLAPRKTFCIASVLAGSVVLCSVPLTAWKGSDSAAVMIGTLVAGWCAYYFLENAAGVALWSWLGDLMPPRIRGRLLGRRERWQVGGRIAGLGCSVTLALLWPKLLPGAERWVPLAISATAGAVLMALSVLPLLALPAMGTTGSARPQSPWRTLIQALVDRPYRRLLAFSCWHGMVTGITAAAQELYPIRVLRLQYYDRQALQAILYSGQSAIAPWMGRLVDRWGNRPVMIVCQLIVATGPLFFLMATPEKPWIVAGAFLVWITYAGMNVGLDNIKLKLAPAENNAPFLAVYFAISNLANGFATILGGFAWDRLRLDGEDILWLYSTLFIVGWLGRTLTTVFLARLIEPGAKSTGAFLAGEAG
jgi:MFS family permease